MSVNLEKIKSWNDVRQREVFKTFDSALEYFGHVNSVFSEDSAPSVSYTVYGHQITDEGLVPDDSKPWPTDDQGQPYAAVVTTLNRQKTDSEGKNKMIPAVIILHPMPTVDQLLATPEGGAMIEAVIAKELNHRLVRPLRNAENIGAAIGEMPATIAQYCTSGRESSQSSALAVFNDLFTEVNKYLKDKVPAYKTARVTKDHLRKCLENTAFATHYYPALEDAGLFKMIIALWTKIGANKEYDVSVLETWLSTRDDQTYSVEADSDGLDDLSGLLDGFDVESAEAAE